MQPSPTGATPLQDAWQNRHWEVTRYLLQAIQARRSSQYYIPPSVLSQLLEIASESLDYAVHIACSQGSLKTVLYLHLSLKCNLTKPNSEGMTPLSLTRSNGRMVIAKFMLNIGKCTDPDVVELHRVCITGDVERVKATITNKASFECTDSNRMTVFHYASCEPEVLMILDHSYCTALCNSSRKVV